MEEPHVDDENSQNEENGAPKIKSTILDNFRNLTKNKDKIRLKAASQLVKYLLENYEAETEIKYALGRLIRGLGSSTNVARFGFYSTLVPLLSFLDVSVDQVFEHVDKELHKAKSNSKSENADIYAGQVLVCCAIIRSDLFGRSSEENQIKILQCLLNAGKGRSYLLYPAYQVLLEATTEISEGEFKKIFLPLIQEELNKPWDEYNLDTLYLLIWLREKYRKVIDHKILKKITGSIELITEANLEQMVQLLTGAPGITTQQHAVHEIYVKHLVETDLTVKFVEYLDKVLSKQNRNKHLIIIKILSLILINTKNPNEIPKLIQENFIRQTLAIFRQLSNNKRDVELKKETHKIFEDILECLKRDVKDKTKIDVLKKLLFSPGTFIFEKVTKSKLIQQITGTLQSEGVKKLAKLYRDVIVSKADVPSEQLQNSDRLYAAHLLVKLVSHPTVANETEWKCEQLKVLMKLGLTKQPNIGVELAGSLKDTFYRSLDLKLTKLNDVATILTSLSEELHSSIAADNLDNSLRTPIAPETYQIWLKAKTLLTKIASKKVDKIKLVFQILFLHLGLQLYNDVKLAKDALEELFSCYERVKKGKRSDENDPDWIEVIVEVFLSLLSHGSHALRKIINCVFPHLCKFMNATAIHQILSVIDPKNEDNPLTSKDDISDEEEDVEDEESEDEEVEEEEEEEEDLSDDEETNVDKLKSALQVALMQNSNPNDESDIDLDEMDEEECDKLNKALGDVFKEFKPNLGKTKKQSKNDETLTHFRVRVLDLIEIYIDSNPSMSLALEIMLPLLQLLQFCIRDDHQKPLLDRTRGCLKKLTSLKKFDDVDGVSEVVLCELLRSLLEKGDKNALVIQFMNEEIANCCTFVIKCSQNLTQTPKKIRKSPVVKIMNETLDSFINRRDCCVPLPLFKYTFEMNWVGNVALAEHLSVLIFDDSIKAFRKSQAVDLLKIFYVNNRFLSSTEDNVKNEIEQVTINFLTKCDEFFQNLKQNADNIKERLIASLFNLLISIKKSRINCDDFNWKNLGENIRNFRSTLSINQETKRGFSKLCSLIGVSNIVEMEQNLKKLGSKTNEDIPTANNEKKKHKVKKSNENLKLKKEAKKERMKTLSEGLEGGFSAMENINGVEDDEEIKVNESKKRKINGDVRKTKKLKT